MPPIALNENWDASDAKRILQHDLANKSLPILSSKMPVKDAWLLYKDRQELTQPLITEALIDIIMLYLENQLQVKINSG